MGYELCLLTVTKVVGELRGWMHALQAESEIFRRGQCQAAQDEEEADYEEYQRRMRAAAKAKAPPVRRSEKATTPQPACEPEPGSTQEQLEKEHEARVDAHCRLEEREHRLDALVSETLQQREGAMEGTQPMTVEELRSTLQANERAMQEDAVEFVGSYMK